MHQRLTNGSAVDDVPMPQKKAKKQKKQKKQQQQKKQKQAAREAKVAKGGSKVSLFSSMLSKVNIFRRSSTKDKLTEGLSKTEITQLRLMVDRQQSRGEEIAGGDKKKKKLTKKIKMTEKKQRSSKHNKESLLKSRLSSRNSAPHMFKEAQRAQRAQQAAKKPSTQRSSSQPILVKFLPTYVNRLKACPLSLGEKLSRWCHVSPMALYDGCPPQDHFLDFPLAEYRDIVWERQGELRAAGHACEPLYDPAKRDEVVLTRYAPGQHGLTPYLNDAARKNTDVNKPSLPPPKYEDTVKSKKSSRYSYPSHNEGEFDPARRASAPADQRSSDTMPTPAPITRVATNCSMAGMMGSMLDLNKLDIPLNAIQEEDVSPAK